MFWPYLKIHFLFFIFWRTEWGGVGGWVKIEPLTKFGTSTYQMQRETEKVVRSKQKEWASQNRRRLRMGMTTRRNTHWSEPRHKHPWSPAWSLACSPKPKRSTPKRGRPRGSGKPPRRCHHGYGLLLDPNPTSKGIQPHHRRSPGPSRYPPSPTKSQRRGMFGRKGLQKYMERWGFLSLSGSMGLKLARCLNRIPIIDWYVIPWRLKSEHCKSHGLDFVFIY